MNEKIARILVETAVRKTIRDIQQDPRRSMRNLMDMALNFAGGRFQQRFFEKARQMLDREDSAYYALVEDMVKTVSTERLVTFGMNVGYNGCTAGAKTIRQIEEAEGFNIPFCLSIVLDEEIFLQKKDTYIRLIQEGQALGIYIWQLHIPKLNPEILEFISHFPDSAFLLFCLPDSLTPQLLARSKTLNNLMLACIYREETRASCEKICPLLRQQGYLYGLYLPYDARWEDRIKDHALGEAVTSLRPSFTFFAPDGSLAAEIQNSVYSFVQELRSNQEYPTVFMELLKDNQQIDSIISSEGCSGGFLPSGQLFSLDGHTVAPQTNLFYHSLKDILKLAFPKGKG